MKHYTDRRLHMHISPRLRACLIALCLLVLGASSWPWGGPDAAAQAAQGTIAYVRNDTGDEIRLIEPDGSNDRRLWAHGLDDPQNVYGIYNMAWRPDGRELAFASTHENWCSINYSDVFAVAPSGRGYRRMTQAPACADFARFAKGTVRVPVRNVSGFGNTFTGFVYFQGAPSLLPVTLAPGASTVVTFNDVADFGPGVLQVAGVVDGANREYAVGTAADVQTGQTISSGSMAIATPRNMGQEPRSPTWRSDGARLGYAYGYASLYGITADPAPVAFGERIIDSKDGPTFVEYMAYGPAPTHSGQVLYQGSESYVDGIYLVAEGSKNAGELLVSSDGGLIQGLAWLPDGSGFLYSVEEYEDYEVRRSNLFEYSFATRQSRRLTTYDNAFVGQMSVAPDGQLAVFELASSRERDATIDLWVINRASNELKLLTRNASAPAWSRGALPPPLAPRAHLPLLRR